MQFTHTIQRYRLDYRVVLEFRVLHDYYVDGRCRDLDIRPTPETQARLRGCRLLFRREDDGFLLALDGQADHSAPIFSRPETFDFVFRVANPHFIRYTDLPFESSQFHFFESKTGGGSCLHAGSFVDGSSILPSDADGVTGLIRIVHDAEQPLIPPAGSTEPDAVRLHFVRFNTRSVSIRYLFHGSEGLAADFHEYSVENFEMNGKPYIFSRPRLRSLRNGESAFEVVSEGQVELKRFLEGHGTLKKARSAGNPFLYRKALPLPKPENVAFDPALKQFFAELFVKL